MGGQLVLRKPSLYVATSVAEIAFFAVFVFAATRSPNSGAFFGAIVMSAFIYGLWLIGGHSAVRVGREGVAVDNLFIRNEIPWSDIEEVEGANGLLILTRSGKRVDSIMYGGSLLGLITRSPQSRSVARQIMSYREKMLAENSLDLSISRQYRARIYFQVWPPLSILAATELVAALAFAFH